MYLQRIQNTIKGYVNVKVEGYYIEKFINMCRGKGIILGNLNRLQGTIITADISVKEFKEVCKLAKKNKCKIKIERKKGIPFILYKYKKRKVFIFSLIFTAAVLIVLSNFVWNIEVVGNENINSSEILELIKDEGVEIGKLKNKIDTKNVVEKIRMERSDVSWAGIKISGTNVVIEIVEADKAPRIIPKDEYCNIVANKDAMIVTANAQNGTLQVKEGDVVKKGSVLIAGWLEGKYTGTRYVHATGEIKAKVWYSEKSRIYFKQNVKKTTGNKEKKYSININNFAINFYKKLSKFEIYDTISTEKRLKISSNFYLPFSMITKENSELIEVEQEYSKQQATEIGVNQASEALDKKINNKEDIINKYINTNESTEYIDVEVVYEVLENIGTEEKIAM